MTENEGLNLSSSPPAIYGLSVEGDRGWGGGRVGGRGEERRE